MDLKSNVEDMGFGEVEKHFLQRVKNQCPTGTVLFTPLFSLACDIFFVLNEMRAQ